MADTAFNIDDAFHYLRKREEKQAIVREKRRLELLPRVISILSEELTGHDVELFLIGSILHPYKFNHYSDIDIVLKNYQGDRFCLWTALEAKIGLPIEVILYEECHFQKEIIDQGLKVL